MGKGVIIANDFEEAQQAVNSMLNDRKFGDSSKKIVIEEFLSGPEVIVLAFTDGESVVPMVSSMDHKRAYDDDKGLNTGGMGTIAPNPFYTKEVEKEALEKIFIPTINAMNKEGRTFRGCLYFGLMITPQGVKVIEYNARFGDPEAQVVLPMLKTELVEIMEAIWKKRLKDIDVQWHDGACACVVLASGGYPEKYQTGKEIVGFNSDGQLDDSSSYVYHAGTVKEGNKYLTNGGRVLGVTCRASTLSESVEAAYKACERIKFEKMHFRKDIGKKAL